MWRIRRGRRKLRRLEVTFDKRGRETRDTNRCLHARGLSLLATSLQVVASVYKVLVNRQ